MSHTITAQQACNQLSGLIHSLRPGDEIILTENDEPVARILPNSIRPKRVAGVCQGMLTIVVDDESHLEDFREYIP